MTTRIYTAFADGSCLYNGTNRARGGWGTLVRNPEGAVLELAGPLTDGHHPTNSRAELTAVIKTLEAIQEPAHINLHADSTYVVNGINQWLAGWKARGWRKADKKPLENADLWQALDALLGRHSVTAHWIKGHSGHTENERVDALAGHAAQFQKQHRKMTQAVETAQV